MAARGWPPYASFRQRLRPSRAKDPNMTDPVIYAIGDIHGEAERLADLHAHIFHHHSALHKGHPITIIHLGDYVDRGPDSCGVIKLIRRLSERPDCKTISLRGNHEQMMLEALSPGGKSNLDFWLRSGGAETLQSYINHGYEEVPGKHLTWMNALPSLHTEPEAKLIFVHAGIDPALYPNCREDIRLWTRSARFFASDLWSNPALEGWRVVHGHTPTDDFEPELSGADARRINIDTGAVFGGALTAAVFAPGEAVRFLTA